MGTIVDALVHPIAAFRTRAAAASWRSLPFPDDDPIAHSPGPDADRILLLGGAIAVGYGVRTHELALGGGLARRVGDLTSRGVLVKIAAEPEYTLVDVPTLLDELRVSRFDALVLAFGGADTYTLPPRRWRVMLDGVLDHLASLDIVGLQIFVVGMPKISSRGRPYATLANRRATQFDLETRAACDSRPSVTFLPLSSGTPGTGPTDRGVYNIWAIELAPLIAEALDASALSPVELDPPDEALRQAAVDELSQPTEAQARELREMLIAAKNLFGVVGAAVNIIDGDRQRVYVSSGDSAPDLPRAGSLCNYTIQTNDVMVVPDARTESRYQDLAWAFAEHGLRFYAGFPLEAPGGERVGALCIVDAEPREFSDADTTLLREIALRAQQVLWHPPSVNPS